MDSPQIVESQLIQVIEKAARNLKLRQYSYSLDLNADKGDGFLGEIYRTPLLDEISNTTTQLIIKRAPVDQNKRKDSHFDSAYINEISFYTEIFPALEKFQKERGVTEIFDKIPVYLASVSTPGREILAFKDLTVDGFVMREKDLLLDDEHAKLIFSVYGRLHAISFSMKDQDPEKYYSLTKRIKDSDVYIEFANQESFNLAIKDILEKSLEAVKDSMFYEKCKKIAENCTAAFQKFVHYRGKYSCILHGDCWSNNMMFKYQDPTRYSQLQNMKLLDFQLIREGTPVYDLSYFFYTGGSKELFDKLEEYLDIYHENFSKMTRELGSDPDELLPRKVLSDDWKEYFIVGTFMAFVLTKIKLISKEDSRGMTEVQGDAEASKEKWDNAKMDDDLFNERVGNVWFHLNEIGALEIDL